VDNPYSPLSLGETSLEANYTVGLYGRRCTSARDNALRPIGRSGKVCSAVKERALL
jgi:hypothetical protein